MGLNALSSRSTGQTVEAEDVNQYKTALSQDHIPRNSTGTAEASAGSLGTSSLPWANLYLSGLVTIAGSVVDFSNLTSETHQIISGDANTSGYPTFLTFVGSSTTGRIYAADTDLELIINGASLTLDSNIDMTGCTLAPSANNTCAVNNTDLDDQHYTTYLGQNGEALAIDAIGSEISSLDGTVQCFSKGNEYFLALIDSGNNQIFPFMRGVARSDRETLADNDTLTLLKATWIFLDSDGINTYKTNIFPTWQTSDPSSPTSNQWYFNTTSKRWRLYDGSFSNQDSHMIGFVICDDTEAVAAHSNDFDLSWKPDLEGNIYLVDDTSVRVQLKKASIAGRHFDAMDYGQVINLSTSGDRESGVTETSDTTFYIYVDNNLKCRFSNKAPRLPDHRLGMYHPAYYWRYVGYCYNNSAGNLSRVLFNGNNASFVEAESVIEGDYTAAPVYVDSDTISVSRIASIDNENTDFLYKNTSTECDISATGVNGVAQSANLSGTVSVSASGTGVTGVGTSFSTNYVVGDVITTAGGQSRKITEVTSDTTLVVTPAWTSTESGVTYKRGGEVPDTHYYLYAIGDGEALAGLLFSTRNTFGGQTLVDLPIGYTKYKQLKIGVLNDDGGDIVPFQVGAGWPHRPEIYYKTETTHATSGWSNGDTNVLSNGTATTATDVATAYFKPPISKRAILHVTAYGSTSNGNIQLTEKDGTESIRLMSGSTGAVVSSHIIQLATNDTGVIQYKNTNMIGTGVDVIGYVVTEG